MDESIDFSKQNQTKIAQAKEMFKEDREKNLNALEAPNSQTKKLTSKAKIATVLSTIGFLLILCYVAMSLPCMGPCQDSGCAICGWMSLIFWRELFLPIVLLFFIALIIAIKVKKELSKEQILSDTDGIKKYCNTTFTLLCISIISLVALFCFYYINYKIIWFG